MKYIVSIMLMVLSFVAQAQTASNPQKGLYGPQPQTTLQPQSLLNPIYKTPAGTTKTLDTLVNADTGYVVYPQLTNSYNLSLNITVTQLTGTVAGTVVLEGSDNASFTTPYAITGTVTQCAGCTGASGTLSGSGTFKWLVPSMPFPYFRIRAITTGTSTATYTSSLNTYKW